MATATYQVHIGLLTGACLMGVDHWPMVNNVSLPVPKSGSLRWSLYCRGIDKFRHMYASTWFSVRYTGCLASIRPQSLNYTNRLLPHAYTYTNLAHSCTVYTNFWWDWSLWPMTSFNWSLLTMVIHINCIESMYQWCMHVYNNTI